MRKIYGAWLACMLLSVCTFGQDADYTRAPSIGVYFFLNDFKTAAAIRNSSLNTVLDQKQFGNLKEMSPGLAITYIKGLSNHFDYSVTASGSFVDFPLQNRPAETTSSDKFFLEVDASITGKMVTDRYWLIPTFSAGVGASKYGSYYGAFIPVGVGLQLNFFDEAYLLIGSQYRIPITETNNYHFMHSIGIAGNIFNKNGNGTSKLKPRPEQLIMTAK
jgi:OmpA-OmpF porin, OOP family